jgi:hypothetical protein
VLEQSRQMSISDSTRPKCTTAVDKGLETRGDRLKVVTVWRRYLTPEHAVSIFVLVLRLLLVIFCLAGAACASSDIESRELLETAEDTIHAGVECRSSVSRKPEYRSLAQHIPLVDVNKATLTQMTDTSLPTRDDYSVIADWQQDIRARRDRLLEVIERTDPLFVRSSSPDGITTTRSWSCLRGANLPGVTP